jgi:hypothetical protein
MKAEDLVRKVEEELQIQGLRFRIARRSPLPNVGVDQEQCRSALAQVIEFCRVLPKNGTELEVHADLREIDGKRYVELWVGSAFVTPVEIQQKELLQPVLQVGNYQLTLDMKLAGQILRRGQGKLLFRKVEPHGKLVTILLRCSG